jgi:hypothetical protein
MLAGVAAFMGVDNGFTAVARGLGNLATTGRAFVQTALGAECNIRRTLEAAFLRKRDFATLATENDVAMTV